MNETLTPSATSSNGSAGLIDKIKRFRAEHPELSLEDAVAIVRRNPERRTSLQAIGSLA